MKKVLNIGGLVEESGYPVRRVSSRRWRLKVETGLVKLFLEIVAGPTYLWVRTSGYLEVPQTMRDDRSLIRLALVSDVGLARFRPIMNRADGLKGIEAMACMPHEGLTRTQVRALISAVIEAAVWRSPSFQAVVRGLPVPPAFPDGRDPSLGILWSEDE